MAAPHISTLLTPRGASFSIPPFDEIAQTFVGVTNNVATQVFKRGGTTVATLTYTYVAAGASDDDDISGIVMTVP